MQKKIEMIGKRFGRLLVIEESKVNRHGAVMWLCKCDCGMNKIIRGAHLRNGGIKSCGCFSQEKATKHGMYGTPVYVVWGHMLQRCTNPKDKEYKNYGGRGITICRSWFDFVKFYADMGEKPKGLSIERRNNELGYNKKNCYWATPTMQSRNRRKNIQNKTGIKGVCWCKQTNKYLVQIGVNKRNIFIGRFPILSEAATARKEAEIKYW